MNKISGKIFLILLGFLCIQNSFSLEKTIILQDFSITVPIEFVKNGETWAEYILQKTADYLTQTETYLNSPFRFKDGFTIKCCDDCGSMNSSEVFINYSRNPALLFHELGHFWFGYSEGHVQEQWLVEGIVSFLPAAMSRGGMLDLSTEEYEGVWDAWLFNIYIEPEDDVYLSYEKTFSKDVTEQYDNRYFKSFKVQYLIFMELGGEGYRRFLQLLLTEKPQSNDEVMDILSAVKQKNWRAFLTGWVFDGDYTTAGMEAFKDSDVDGLLDIEEEHIGTLTTNPDTDSDGYSDYWEYTNDFNPTLNTGSRLSSVPVIDGVAEKMGREPDHIFRDKRSDSKASADIDFIEVYNLPEIPGKLYLRVFFVKKELRDSFHTLHLRIHSGKNYWIQTSHPVKNIWASEFTDGESFEEWQKIEEELPGIRMQFCDAFEAVIDLADLNINDDFQLAYIAGGYTGNEHIWDSDRSDFLTVTINDQ